MISKPDFCAQCPITHVTKGYSKITYPEPHNGILFVGEASGEDEAHSGRCFSGGAGTWLTSLTKCAKIDRTKSSLINVIGCHPPANIFPLDSKWTATSREDARHAVAHCASHHLWPAINSRPWSKIIALGDRALEAITPRKGIQTWRGSPLPLRGGMEAGPRVIPTLHPAYLMRVATLFSVCVKDLKKSLTLPPENYNLWPTITDVEEFHATEFAFDFEWDRDGNITICGLCDRFFNAIVVPWSGLYMPALKRIFESATKLIGHNIIEADMRHLEKTGWNITAEIHDTILKQHLVQPDMRHGLNFVASVFTNKVFWKGRGDGEEDESGITHPTGAQWKTWDSPEAIPKSFGGYGGCRSADEAYRLYNARDTDAEYQINYPLNRLLREHNLEHIYWNVSLPAAYICRDMSEAGLKLNTSRLGEVRDTIDIEIARYEQQLPVGLAPYEIEITKNIPAPEGSYKPKTKICKGTKNARHEPSSISFNSSLSIVCPICGRTVSPGKLTLAKIIKEPAKELIVPYNSAKQVQEYAKNIGCKEIINRKTGNATTGDSARKVWARDHPEFSLLTQLKEKVTLRNNFAKDTMLLQERMFFNLHVYGTSEGRLSSSGQREGIDLNIQNQPKEFRIIYVPDFPDWSILNIDIVQGENWLTTWLAKDWERWERLQTLGYDEHAYYATNFFGQPCYKGTPGEYLRIIGKIINHMMNYGAGWKKLQETLNEAGYNYSAADCKEAIATWKKVNARTAEWQTETIALAGRQGYLANPFGRKRWFSHRDYASKSLAFLPASTLADMVLRMMIAHYPQRFPQQCEALGLGVVDQIVDGWRLAINGHDALTFMGPKEGLMEQAVRTKKIMTQPWRELEGFAFKVEVEASDKSWGECKVIDV